MEVVEAGRFVPVADYDLPSMAAYLFYAARQGMVMTDEDGRVIAANVAAQRLTGYREAEMLGGLPHLFDGSACSDRVIRQVLRLVQRTGHWEGELWCCRKDGSRYLQRTSMTTLPGGGYALIFHDATAQLRREEALTRMAFTDPLTGLPNRALFTDRLNHALAHARRQGEGVALLFVDLDGFKSVNDSHGHSIGDALLQMAAGRLRDLVRADDTAARYGGDEFAVVMEGLNEPGDASLVADKLAAALAAPFVIDGKEYSVSASIGVALFPQHAADAERMIECADAAMYRAKRAGKGSYRVAQ